MIGKTRDSGFRDYDLIYQQYMLAAAVKVKQIIEDMKEEDMMIVDRHNHMMDIDQQTPGRRYLNTFDFDEILGADFFDCLVQEQGINDFEPFALVEYKIWSKTKKAKLRGPQKKALIKMAKKASLPAYVIWSMKLDDGTYNWFAMCIYSPDNEEINKLWAMTDRQYYVWKMKMRRLKDLINPTYNERLSDSLHRNYEKFMDNIIKEGIE